MIIVLDSRKYPPSFQIIKKPSPQPTLSTNSKNHKKPPSKTKHSSKKTPNI